MLLWGGVFFSGFRDFFSRYLKSYSIIRILTAPQMHQPKKVFKILVILILLRKLPYPGMSIPGYLADLGTPCTEPAVEIRT